MKMRWKTIAIAVAAVVGTTTAILRFAPSSFAPEAQRDAVHGPRVTHRAKPQVMFPELTLTPTVVTPQDVLFEGTDDNGTTFFMWSEINEATDGKFTMGDCCSIIINNNGELLQIEAINSTYIAVERIPPADSYGNQQNQKSPIIDNILVIARTPSGETPSQVGKYNIKTGEFTGLSPLCNGWLSDGEGLGVCADLRKAALKGLNSLSPVEAAKVKEAFALRNKAGEGALRHQVLSSFRSLKLGVKPHGTNAKFSGMNQPTL